MMNLTINKLIFAFMAMTFFLMAAALAKAEIETVKVPVLSSRLKAGSVITNSDIEMKEFPAPRIKASIITEREDLVGKSPKRSVAANTPIRVDILQEPSIIKKGDMVEIFYRTATIELKTIGQALEDGAAGQMIKISNIKNKTIIQAMVEAPGIVDASPRKNILASR